MVKGAQPLSVGPPSTPLGSPPAVGVLCPPPPASGFCAPPPASGFCAPLPASGFCEEVRGATRRVARTSSQNRQTGAPAGPGRRGGARSGSTASSRRCGATWHRSSLCGTLGRGVHANPGSRFGALLVLSTVTAAPAAADDVTKVLLTGDSVMQGSAGDWTWRYRLWQHFSTIGSPVDFVGPRTDLYDFERFVPGSYDYVDPGFDTDHAATWGSSFTAPGYAVADLVRDYHPDVIVASFGVNDLVGYYATPQEVLSLAADYVEQARTADPGVDVVLTTLPQVWIAGAADYNAGLEGLASRLSTADSRVEVGAPAEPLMENVDTWDPAHLSATGEVKVAAGVADALASLGVGSPYPRPLPQVPNGPRAPAALTVRTQGSTAAELTWVDPPGATGEYVWMRDVSMDESWRRVVGPEARKCVARRRTAARPRLRVPSSGGEGRVGCRGPLLQHRQYQAPAPGNRCCAGQESPTESADQVVDDVAGPA